MYLFSQRDFDHEKPLFNFKHNLYHSTKSNDIFPLKKNAKSLYCEIHQTVIFETFLIIKYYLIYQFKAQFNIEYESI